jgi:hypothetical protein
MMDTHFIGVIVSQLAYQTMLNINQLSYGEINWRIRMVFDIIGEGHEGVVSCDEEVFASIEAEDAEAAMKIYSEIEPRAHFASYWNVWLIGALKIRAVERIT